MCRLKVFIREGEECVQCSVVRGHSHGACVGVLRAKPFTSSGAVLFPCTHSCLLCLAFSPLGVWLNLVLQILSKLYFIILQSLTDSQFINKCYGMVITSSVKLCTSGVNFRHCHKPARLRYASSWDGPPCSNGVTAIVQSSEIVPFLSSASPRNKVGLFIKKISFSF